MTARSDRSDAAARARGDDTPAEDPGLAGLLAARDAEYAKTQPLPVTVDTSPESAAGADPGVASLLSKRDAAYHAAATAQQEADATAARIGGVYTRYQVPPISADDSARLAKAAASGAVVGPGPIDEATVAPPAKAPRKSRKGSR